MKNIEIKIDKNTRMVDLSKTIIGNDSENLQGKIVFSFVDEFVDGQARLEYEINKEKNWLALEKKENNYEIPIKSVITQKGQINMQLVITENENELGIPVFRSNIFYLYCNSSINAVEEAPDGYESWLEIANSKLNAVDNLDIDITTADDTTRVEITKKDGTKKSAIVSGGAGTITDVKVDGDSVVKGGVADINFKTINNQSIIGEGNINIEGGNGVVGADGKSAYEIWLEQGYTGTEQDFLNSLKGETGTTGQDGYSPSANVTQTDNGAIITITDKNGTTTTNITNGKDGKDGYTPVKGVDYFDGQNGKDGADGYSPTAKVQTTSTGATITITDKNGTTTTNITNGKDGAKGDKGDKGEQGIQGETGSKGADGYTPVKGTDYWTEEDKNEIKEYVKDEIPTKTSQLDNDSGFMTELTDENISEIAEEVVLASKWNDLGSTPFTTTETNNYRLKADGEATYTTKSDTVAVIDENTEWARLSYCTASHDKGYWEIVADDNASNIYSTYAQAKVSGLVIGQQYKLIIDGRNLTNDLTNGKPWLGYIQLINASGNVYAKYQAIYGTPNPKNDQITFTATEETTIIRVQLAVSTFTSIPGTTVNFHKIYINHVDGGNEATQIANTTATFTDSVTLGQLEAGIQITSTPTCKVYSAVPEVTVHIPKSRHEGKTCVCFGDSIVGNMAEPNDYPTVLGEETGMTVINAGFGGCRMSDTMTNEYKPYSMVKIANAIATGDWTEQETGLSEVTISHYAPHIETLKNINWYQVDFITIGYGTNDIANFVAVDNEGEGEEYNPLDTTTVLGGLRYALTTILTAYPHLKVLILTPIYRYFNNEGVDSDEKEWYNNREFTTWTDGILDVAKEFRVPGVDMYRTLGFNKITRSYYYPSNDGTHPNHLGLKVIAGKIAGKLLSEY